MVLLLILILYSILPSICRALHSSLYAVLGFSRLSHSVLCHEKELLCVFVVLGPERLWVPLQHDSARTCTPVSPPVSTMVFTPGCSL